MTEPTFPSSYLHGIPFPGNKSHYFVSPLNTFTSDEGDLMLIPVPSLLAPVLYVHALQERWYRIV